MDEKAKKKIVKLLALANDANDEESMSALAKAQELMLQHNIDESDVFHYKQEQKSEAVINTVIYEGRPQKWLYRLARIIAKNFRVRYYYVSGKPIELHFVGIVSDVQIAQITFEYARGSASYCARQFLQLPDIRRKYKRKWQLKQDYLEGYLKGLSQTFRKQVLTNGYELALQVPEVVQTEVEKIGLVPGKDTSHTVRDWEAFYAGYAESVRFKDKDRLGA
ncbi:MULTISPECIES: DUF2786 domain-containing protein [Enterococcus]|uniref:DUF2786 domain-containing protein n=1 Tax=Enterococcus casseliflavus TaxID=37734 RepID=A0ABD6YZ64_ENTCA|nr:DUF2786 domain-containing protein [Enterococcus casseliflavus]EOH83454.1 hypothetical protein UAM_00877 [Enterococcus casseliflavus ATCC 49996]EOU10949.1 hypothetical protein I582_01463 [Enterococcus casseliflavus ATCC 49996]MCD5162271.1 DUF2786 domain-containing protein [Enterococcus casseliflavus]MCD5192865.1 DUF2786 domain-containing protein [Enterococcus casseliflavus]MDT2962786.1 DUF2786 domain-containing protein [Enterococcus casseliflavus]